MSARPRVKRSAVAIWDWGMELTVSVSTVMLRDPSGWRDFVEVSEGYASFALARFLGRMVDEGLGLLPRPSLMFASLSLSPSLAAESPFVSLGLPRTVEGLSSSESGLDLRGRQQVVTCGF